MYTNDIAYKYEKGIACDVVQKYNPTRNSFTKNSMIRSENCLHGTTHHNKISRPNILFLNTEAEKCVTKTSMVSRYNDRNLSIIEIGSDSQTDLTFLDASSITHHYKPWGQISNHSITQRLSNEGRKDLFFYGIWYLHLSGLGNI